MNENLNTSPILIGTEPIKVVINEQQSKFEHLSERMNEIKAKRKQFEQNLQKSTKRPFLDDENDVTKKVNQAIDDAIKNQHERFRVLDETLFFLW